MFLYRIEVEVIVQNWLTTLQQHLHLPFFPDEGKIHVFTLTSSTLLKQKGTYKNPCNY